MCTKLRKNASAQLWTVLLCDPIFIGKFLNLLLFEFTMCVCVCVCVCVYMCVYVCECIHVCDVLGTRLMEAIFKMRTTVLLNFLFFIFFPKHTPAHAQTKDGSSCFLGEFFIINVRERDRPRAESPKGGWGGGRRGGSEGG